MSCPLGLSAVRACCPALCRCSISTLQFLGNSFPITLLPSILSVYLLRYVLFYSFLLFVTFLRLFDTFPFYGSISPFIPLSSPFILIPPIIPPFPFSPVFPPVSPFFPVSRGFSGLFGAFRLVPLVLVRSGRSGIAGCYTCLWSSVPAPVPSFPAVPLVLRGGPLAVLPGLPPSAPAHCPAHLYSGLVFFARASWGGSAAGGGRAHKKAERRRLFGVVAPGLVFYFPAARARMIINAQIKQ